MDSFDIASEIFLLNRRVIDVATDRLGRTGISCAKKPTIADRREKSSVGSLHWNDEDKALAAGTCRSCIFPLNFVFDTEQY